MNDLEWMAAAMAHREPSSPPYNFLCAPTAQTRLEEHYGAPLSETLEYPMRMAGSNSIKPLYASPAEFGPTAVDEFGVVWTTRDIDRGIPGPCLAEPDLTGYTFPDPTREYRFEDFEAWSRENEGHYRVIWVGDLWERAAFMRGMDHILLDLVLHPAFVRQLLRQLGDYILATMEIILARYEFECIAVSDDYGAQASILMSPRHWREFIKPVLAEIYAMAKERGLDVFHHSCGNLQPVIGDMIDIGLDILHPIQPEAMDVLALKREFGADVTFCGGVPTQTLLPYGTPEQVRDEVLRLKETLGKGGGYILEPGITLQDDVPLANMTAMIDVAREGRPT